MAQLLPLPRIRFFDSNGVPLAAGKLYSYAAGTTTPLATYTDSTAATPNANPIILDSNGECSAWIGSSAYKFILKTSADATIWTVDNVSSINDGSITTSKLADGAVTNVKLGDSSVTTVKIQDLAVTTPKLADAAVTTIKITDANVTTAKIADANVTTPKIADANVTLAKLGPDVPIGRNRIINGNMLLNRGLGSFSAAPTGTFLKQRWVYTKSGTMVHTLGGLGAVAPPTVAQAGTLFPDALGALCSTAQVTIGSTDFCLHSQKIEGYNFALIAQKTFTLSFWIYAFKTGIRCVAFRNSGHDRSYVAEYTVNASNTWEKKTITVSASPSAGTWDYTKFVGLSVDFTLAAGSSFQTTANAWQSGNYLSTSNQINDCDSTSNATLITGVQLEEGPSARPFENISVGLQNILVARYFQGVLGRFLAYNPGQVIVAAIGGSIIYPVAMRNTPASSLGIPVLVNANNAAISSTNTFYIDVQADFLITPGAAVFDTGVITLDAEL